MYRLCINSRDELLIIDLSKVAYCQANGNYTQLTYIGGKTHLLTLGLSKVEEFIRRSWPASQPSPFVRLGRSLIINQAYLTEISETRQKITLSDYGANHHTVSVPKPLLKQYKEKIGTYFASGRPAALPEKK